MQDDEKEKPKTSYTRTYSNLGKTTSQDDEKDKPKTSYTRTYSNLGKAAASIDDDKPKTYSRTYTASTAKVSDLKKEPSPPKRTTSRLTAKDLSTETKSRLNSAYSSTSKKEGPPITFNTRYKVSSTSTRGTRSPSPSVASENSTKNSLSRISSGTARSRDPSPFNDTTSDKTSLNRTFSNSLSVGSKTDTNKSLGRSLSTGVESVREKLEKSYSSSLSTARERSRERTTTTITPSTPRSRNPSPVDSRFLSLSSYRDKSKERSTSITLNSSNYRLSSREASPIALSYMSTTESLAATAARATRISFINRHSPQKETVENVAKSSPIFNHKKQESETSSSDEETTDESSEEEEEEENLKKPEPKIMIQVSTITRGTSPNPPGTSTTSRVSRRIEVAKTIEKVRERPLIAPLMNDKATQSDRMDDTTRYSRYGITVRSGYSPYSPSPNSYSSRITSGLTASSRYAREQSEVSNADTEKSESSQKSDKFNFPIPKSKEGSPVKSDTSRASSIKSPTPSKICISKDRNRLSPPSQSKSKSPETSKPQSPIKVESIKIESPKLTNKDFRKSALNTGPSDRQNRSKSTSSENSSPTVEKTRAVFQQIMANNEPQVLSKQLSLERSSSVESDSSTESIEIESQLQLSNHEMTKEEKIVVKVEEAKSFLLKTLGNASSFNKQIEDDENDTSASTNYPTQSNDEIDFINSQNNENEQTWYANESSTQTMNCDEDTIISEIDTTLQPDQFSADQIVNGVSEMTLNPSTNEQKSSKWLWNETKLNLNCIVRADSGEKAWWCQSPENKIISDNLEAIAQNNESIANNIRWEQETQADVSELQKDEEIQEIEKNFHNNFTLFDTNILGDRASPEGLESHISDRKSPYENLVNSHAKTQSNDFNARPKMFISRHTNIDDLLGNILKSC